MIRRIAFAAICLLVLATSASAQPSGGNLSKLQEKVNQANKQEGVLTSSIATMNERIHSLRSSVASAEANLARLQVEVSAHEQRLGKVRDEYERQSRLLALAQRQYDYAQHQLSQRLVAVYESDQPDTVAVMLASESISNAIDRLEYLNAVSARDRHVAERAVKIKHRWTEIRNRTHRLLVRVADETHAVELRASRVLTTRDRLSSNRERLSTERETKQETLASVRESKEKWLADIAALQAGSANIASRLRSGGSHSTSTPSAAGLIWPVQGVLTSPFGMRWGRMHEGIDIGAPQGTPIYSAAGGDGELRGLGGRLRQPNADRPRKRACHGLRAPVELCGLERADRVSRPTDRLRGLDRALHRPARALRGSSQRGAERPAELPLVRCMSGRLRKCSSRSKPYPMKSSSGTVKPT
jgi:murein DD-endopeptidase MepM/ murein hydrolase activator NlpD